MLRLIALLSLAFATAARAEAPRVVTDIAPVHSLVAMVMGDVGAPTVLLPPGANPHSYAMRPSEAASLEEADLVIWIGPGLTPWLERPVQEIAANAAVLTLLEIAPVRREFKDPHDEHHEDEDEDEHAHGDIDPHAWLDPMNASSWVGDIARALAKADPANADTYRSNAAQALEQIVGLQAQMAITLTNMPSTPYAVHHDAYGYLEARFGLEHRFAITDSHAQEPGPKRIAELQESVRKEDISCILSDGSGSTDLLETVIEAHHAKVLTADPTGAGIAPGPLLYMDLMSGISLTLSDC